MDKDYERVIREADASWTPDLMNSTTGACVRHRRDLLTEIDALRCFVGEMPGHGTAESALLAYFVMTGAKPAWDDMEGWHNPSDLVFDDSEWMNLCEQLCMWLEHVMPDGPGADVIPMRVKIGRPV